MIFPAEFGELMLEREYTCEKSGVKTPLIVQISFVSYKKLLEAPAK